MPTYDYACADCSHEFEQFQSISAAPLETCPQCGGKVARRIHGGAGLIFKGSGFYLTDYKKPSAGSPSTGSGSEGGDKNAGDSAKKADGDTAKKEGSKKKGTEDKPAKVDKKEKTTE
jgi:putative FmdB family regulatory protein